MQSGKAHSWYQAQANWSLASLLFKAFYCFRLFHFYCFLYELLFWVMYGVIFRCNVLCTLGFPPFFLFTLRTRENSSLDQCVCFEVVLVLDYCIRSECLCSLVCQLYLYFLYFCL